MTEVNMMKKPCPQPIISAKKALQSKNSEGVILKVDNLPAVKNLEKLANSLFYGFSFEKLDNNDYKVTIIKPATTSKQSLEVSSPSNIIEKNALGIQTLAITIGSDQMGNGSIDLGKILIKSFIYSLTELAIPPSHIIFFNSGVHLTSNTSNTLDILESLKEKGTSILSCGTCLNYYNLTEKLAIGEVANMYEITEILSQADKIINL